jgi:hypothetical protein
MSIRIGDRIISGSGGAADGESLINQNTSSSIEKVYNWVGTITEYEEQDVANIHPDWVCYIIDDETGDDEEYEVYEISGRNVGDIFFTSRKDLNLSGAVECDGSVYSLSDYEGVESIEELLKSNKLPYVSISEYNTLLETNGSVGVFGWDGNSAGTFRVPTLNEVFIESGKVSSLGDFIKPGLPNITGEFEASDDNSSTITIGAFQIKANGGTTTGGDGREKILTFDASRSSDIYGSSDTVQPQSVCYRPMIQLATGIKEESIYNIENHALFDNRITNCITYIPQDIKLELNNDVLTLKAGSKVYYPDGFESDGTTKKFGCRIIEQDCFIATTGGSGTCMICISSDDDYTATSSILKCLSGDNITPIEYSICYDTATNIIARYGENLAVNIPKASFPLAIVQQVDGVHTSIDQVFNGFGFIGDEFYVLPGVTCLMPDGRNEDGSLKNIEFTTTRVDVCHDNDRNNPMELIHYHKPFFLHSDGHLQYTNWYWQQKDKPTFKSDNNINYWYNTETNQIWYYRYRQQEPEATPVEEIRQCACVGQYLMSSNGITNFRSKQDIQVLDYNNTEYMAHQAMPSDKYIDLTLGASGTSYIAPADGWFYLGKFCIASSSSAGNHCMIMRVFNKDNNVVYIYQDWCNATATTQVMDMNTPVKKGAKVRVEYSLTGATNSFRFIYAEGSK